MSIPPPICIIFQVASCLAVVFSVRVLLSELAYMGYVPARYFRGLQKILSFVEKGDKYQLNVLANLLEAASRI